MYELYLRLFISLTNKNINNQISDTYVSDYCHFILYYSAIFMLFISIYDLLTYYFFISIYIHFSTYNDIILLIKP